jgi:hypothetical protein
VRRVCSVWGTGSMVGALTWAPRRAPPYRG